MRAVPVLLLVLALSAPPLAGAQSPGPVVETVRRRGRPTLLIDGTPHALPTYNPVPGGSRHWEEQVERFAAHGMGAYIVQIPSAPGGFANTPFWVGDEVSAEPLAPASFDLDARVAHILTADPGAWILVRFGTREPRSWRTAHPEELFVTEEGRRLPVPSLASAAFNRRAADYCRAVVAWCEGRPWADRIIGYANFTRMEGTHEPLVAHWLFDHSPVMTARWRAHLRETYATVERLREAHSDETLTFETAGVPTDRLRRNLPSVAARAYWQPAAGNRPLRDYLTLTRELYHARFGALCAAMREATGGRKLLLYDALKVTMLGWSNRGFFGPRFPWLPAFASDRAGSGHLGVARLLDLPGCGGLITPHDYQARGVGGIYEPEGSVDSVVLRGKYFLCEMDTRTYAQAENPRYGSARDEAEFAAVTWRNLATSLTRGFNSYWMDLYTDWFVTDRMHAVIRRQTEVMRQSLAWPHRTVPGIALVLDDEAVLETNGDGAYFNEAIQWEQKTGLSRCGVPYRIYLVDDLRREDFPDHRVFYFPNLFRVDDERLALLRERVCRDGRVVVWGPGSGISDGATLGAAHAERLTGFRFHPLIPVNHPRRTLIIDFSHPVTAALPADTSYGGSLAYGPGLYPVTGGQARELGRAWTKQGANYAGLALRPVGRGAPDASGTEPRGAGDWVSVFTTAVPLPAGLWRGLARHAGAHVWCETNDILLADASVVALHSMRGGTKTIRLPGPRRVTDLQSGRVLAASTATIDVELTPPQTRVFHLAPVAAGP
jgi:hypothetical protein